MNKSLGAIEFRSIAKGIEVSNEMVKKSYVEICYFKSICPGKFLIIVSGNEAEVNDAISFGMEHGGKFTVDSFVIHNIHPQIIQALKHKYEKSENINAIGIMETNKVCAGLKALDHALKSSSISIVKLQVAFGIGGKCVYIVAGELSSLNYGFEEIKSKIGEKEIVYDAIIPSVDEHLLKNLI